MSDLPLEVPMAHTADKQSAFIFATTVMWNTFTAVVEVGHMSTQQAKVAARTWLRSHPHVTVSSAFMAKPDSDNAAFLVFLPTSYEKNSA